MYLDNCLVKTWSGGGQSVAEMWSERGRDVVRWWSERGRDVYRSGKTRLCHVPTTGHCQYDMICINEIHI